MSGYSPFIVFGIITGAIYGLSAMGLLLIYKTSGAFNIPSLFGGVTQDTFNYVQSLLALTVLAIAGSRTITAAFVAPALLYPA